MEEETRAKVKALLKYLNATSTQRTVSGGKEHAPPRPAMVDPADTGPGPAPVATLFENRGESFTATGANAPAGGAGGQGSGGGEKEEEETEEEEELKTVVQLVLEDEIQMNWYPNGDRRRQTHQDTEANMKTQDRVKAWLRGPFIGRGCDDAVVAEKLSKYWQQRHSTLCDERNAGSGNEDARLIYAEEIEHATDTLSTAIEIWAREVELIAVPSTWLLRNMAYELGTPLNNPGRKEKVTERGGGQVVLWVYSSILRGGVCEECVFSGRAV